jgi:hypothetical protein
MVSDTRLVVALFNLNSGATNLGRAEMLGRWSSVIGQAR